MWSIRSMEYCYLPFLQLPQHETSVLEKTFKQRILSTRSSFIHILAAEEEIFMFQTVSFQEWLFTSFLQPSCDLQDKIGIKYIYIKKIGTLAVMDVATPPFKMLPAVNSEKKGSYSQVLLLHFYSNVFCFAVLCCHQKQSSVNSLQLDAAFQSLSTALWDNGVQQHPWKSSHFTVRVIVFVYVLFCCFSTLYIQRICLGSVCIMEHAHSSVFWIWSQ